MNFQMNRWFGWVGEPEMLEEMRTAAPRITTYTDWTREFLALADCASQRGHALRAAFYWGPRNSSCGQTIRHESALVNNFWEPCGQCTGRKLARVTRYLC
jgi:hypothetical protein